MQWKYASPLGKLARLLLWAHGEIELSESDYGKCYATLVSTLAMIRAKRGANTDGTQEELPWEAP